MPGFCLAKGERWVRRKALGSSVSCGWDEVFGWDGVLHPSATPCPVAVVEVEASALEDKGADAILCWIELVPLCRLVFAFITGCNRTCALETVRRACKGIFAESILSSQ